MKMHKREVSNFRLSYRLRRSAFTLIELLIVIAIILILSGISLKIMSMVGNKTGIAKTTVTLEQVKNALAAYYATYGSYPPVNSIKTVAPYNQPTTLATNSFLSRGLMAYIFSGAGVYPAITQAYLNSDAARWDHYLSGIYSESKNLTNIVQGLSTAPLTNIVFTICDAWGNELRYSPQLPDYQGYTLSSGGATGSTNDDIYVTY